MADVLDLLREIDRHFQKDSGLDDPGQNKHTRRVTSKGTVTSVPVYVEYYDLWRELRRTIKELENDRKRLLSGAATGDGGVTTAQPRRRPTTRLDKDGGK